jgi:hypothetical protein
MSAISGPTGTTIVEVTDPARPPYVASAPVPPGTHSHKLRVKNDIMLLNIEVIDVEAAARVGSRGRLAIDDISHWAAR